jgi:ribose-phosphate pyrophosphokinase
MTTSEHGVPIGSAAIAQEKRLLVFSGRGNPELAATVAQELGVACGALTLKTFSAGEIYCRFDEPVRGADVFVIQSVCMNETTGMTANDALVELLLIIDAVGASAQRVIAVVPWFGYSRQDKKELGEPISARLVAHTLEAAGVDRVLTVDLHAAQLQGFFTRPLDETSALLLLVDYFRKQQIPDLVVVSPDVGRVKLNHKFAEKVGADLAVMTKERPAQQVAEIGYVLGSVEGKTALIVDDIIDTAGTLCAAAETVLDAGASRVFAAGTHGLFSGAAYDNLRNGPFEQIVVTDTVPLRPGAPDNIVVVSTGALIADAINQIFLGSGVSRRFGGEKQPI